jgi:hypothetical protein
MDNKFSGFNLPEGAWLPPELISLLPSLSKSQLKVLIVVIFRFMQVGGSEQTSISDIQFITGLSKQSVITATGDLLDHGFILRFPVGRSYSYEPCVQILDRQVVDRENTINTIDDSLSDSLTTLSMITKLRAGGVYVRTAQEIVTKYSEDRIDKHWKYYRYALKKGIAKSAGFFVSSINENWGAPLGFSDGRNNRDPHRYEDWVT